jgi:hypothetical protein
MLSLQSDYRSSFVFKNFSLGPISIAVRAPPWPCDNVDAGKKSPIEKYFGVVVNKHG